MPTSIFVSYSHEDVSLVQPVVRLLRATEGLVFHDLDSIKPGWRWRREIDEALHAAQLVVLFWCHHALRSEEVKKEYELALTIGKDVLPILLDTTPLPEQLNEFQWVDFRLLVGSAHESRRSQVILVVSVLIGGFVFLPYLMWSLSGLFASVVFVVFVVLLFLSHLIRSLSNQFGGAPYSAPDIPQPIPTFPEIAPFVWVILFHLFSAIVYVLVTWIRKSGRLGFKKVLTDDQQQMAEQIQAELLRRGMGMA